MRSRLGGDQFSSSDGQTLPPPSQTMVRCLKHHASDQSHAHAHSLAAESRSHFEQIKEYSFLNFFFYKLHIEINHCLAFVIEMHFTKTATAVFDYLFKRII